MTRVPELPPHEVGTPVPISSKVPPQSYTYDYIIVGGGTAGCVLASRLSEDRNVSVLVIEQGPVADTWVSRVPLMSANPYTKDTLAARWWSLPLRSCDNKYVEIVRGEGLGGGSRVNAMLYTRGTPGDYNQWKALGNEGWGYDDLEPYFAKSEKAQAHPASKYRGKDGVWMNKRNADPYKTNQLLYGAIQKAGIAYVEDFNSPNAPAAGVGLLDTTLDGSGQRHSTYHAFLPPHIIQQRRSHLKVCTNAIATRIEITGEGDNLRASGVYFEATMPKLALYQCYAKARREIILCAGALGSPQLLMLSGIGPKEHLLEKGISVLRDLPALGGHLADHIGLPVMFEVPMSDSLHSMEASTMKAILELLKYVFAGGGLFAQSFQSTSTFIPTRLLDENSTLSVSQPSDLDASVPENRPDIEFMHVPHNCSDTDPKRLTGIFTLLTTLIRPKSEGTVRLATTNPRARPDVDLNFLSNPDDYVPFRKGVRLALHVVDEIRKRGYPIKHFVVPDSESDEDIDRFIRTHLRTSYHYASTCRMGAQSHGARPSVVDTSLRVHGVQGLRVCDTSIFPEIIGSHTMAPAVAVAEKLADMLKARQ